MSKALGKLNDFVTQAVAAIAQAARDFNVLQFADLVKRDKGKQLVSPTYLGTSAATVKAKGRVANKDSTAMLFGLGGETEEDQIEIEISINIDLMRLDAETLRIIQSTSQEDAEKLVVKHKLQRFYQVDESRWVDPDSD